MAESPTIETNYDQTKCLPEKKSEADGPCIMKILKGQTIVQIPNGRIVNHLRDLHRVSIWRSVPNPSELTEPEFTKLEESLGSCGTLTESSFALLERLIGEGESGDEADTTNIVVTEENKTILTGCDLLSVEEMAELDRLLSIPGGKRKSKKNKSKKNKSNKNKSKKNKSRKGKPRKSKSHKK
jgi:hypothetical protein